MNLSVDQLLVNLKRGLAPIYLITGDEPLTAQEAADAVRAAASAAGYERERFTVESGFDWDGFFASTQSLSLFSTRRLLDVRIPTGRPGDAGSKALAEFAARPPADTVLLVTTGKLDSAARASRWAKALDGGGAVVTVYPVEAAQMPGWVARRMQRHGLTPGPGVAELLAHHMEGNLLACAQEIEKIALLRGPGPVALDDIDGNLSDNARFTVYTLADACLLGDGAAIMRIFASLQAEGTAAALILWALVREIRVLAQISQATARGKAPAQAFDEYKVWSRRKPLYAQALKRASADHWLNLLRQAARADRIVKGRSRGNAGHELQRLALAAGGIGSGEQGVTPRNR